MTTVIVGYGSGNLHSVHKAFVRAAGEAGAGQVLLTNSIDAILEAERVVLPGDGAFRECMHAITSQGLIPPLIESVLRRGNPFLGICVGMQLLATTGLENGKTDGFGWIPGTVDRLNSVDAKLKIPHMGWNDLQIESGHPVLEEVIDGMHMYFVHSYRFLATCPNHVLSSVDYGGKVAAIVARKNIIGFQFHPEKSQAAGIRLIKNFLLWKPVK